MATFKHPEDSTLPLYPLAELKNRGLDARRVRSCAVHEDGKVAGCPQADKCVLRHFGSARYAGLPDLHRGPKSAEPGTGGEGPFNVLWYRKDAVSRTERMDFGVCYNVIATLDAEMQQMHTTGNEVKIIGGEGAKYVQRYRIPLDPNNNKTGDARLKEVVQEATVPPFKLEPHVSADEDYAKQMESILKGAAARHAFAGVEDAPAAAPAATAEPVATAEPAKEPRANATRRG